MTTPEPVVPAPAARSKRPAPIPRVHGADEQVAIPIDVLRYVRLAELVLDAERVPRDAEMSVFFVDEPTIAELNIRFLEGTGPTDVLAFPLDEELLGGRHPDQGGRGPGSGDDRDGSEPPVLIGDVIVCPAIAAAQAATAGNGFDDEMALLVVHGTLHLLRYDHAEPAERERMQARERELLARFAAEERAGNGPIVTGSDWAILAVIIVLLFVSAVFAVAEVAFTRMSRVHALALEDEGRRGAVKLVRMLEHPEQTINALLFLILIAQLTSAYLLGVLLEHHAGTWGVVIGLVTQLIVVFVLAEVVPKTYAILHTDRAALRFSGFLSAVTYFPPLRLLTRSLIGLANWVIPGKGLKEGPFVTEEDLRAMADVAADEESIEREERRLIHSIFEFGDTVVREVMLPRTDMVAIEVGATVEDAIERAIEAGYSRIPTYEDTTDDIVGLVYLKDLVRRARLGEGSETVRGSMRPAVFVPEQKRVAELLREMQGDQFHMAIVVDEYGGTSGLVTLEDVLEEIVGEITDEFDVDTPGLELLPGGGVLAPGSLNVDEVSEALGIDLPETESDSVGGLVLELLGHLPEEGEVVVHDGLELRVERVEGRRILAVRIVPIPDPADGEPRRAASGDAHEPASS